MADRTIVIGDLHGCYDEAVALMKKCNVSANDRVIFAGDLIDRGPDNDKCVELAMHREQVQGSEACVEGNHEEKHIFYDDIEQRKGRVDVQVPNHVATRVQLKRSHYDYFRRLPKFIRLPEHNAVVVHAGVWPGRTIEQQSDRHLLHIQMIRPYDQWGNFYRHKDAEKSVWASKVPANEDGWKFWHHFWDGPERIIFGHSVLNKPLITPKAVGIDGGGVFGLNLWAVVLPEWEIVEIKCGKRQDRNRDRELHLIDGDVGTY